MRKNLMAILLATLLSLNWSPNIMAQQRPEDFNHFKEILRFGTNDINLYWQTIFANNKRPYETPSLKAYYKDPIETPCGTMGINNAAYCTKSNTIYFDIDFLYQKFLTYGDYAVITILAHEWAHAAQFQLRQRELSIWTENQADCLCGAYTKALKEGKQNVRLEEGDIEEAEQLMFNIGSSHPDWANNGVHGSSNQRLGNFRKGLIYGLDSCFNK